MNLETAEEGKPMSDGGERDDERGEETPASGEPASGGAEEESNAEDSAESAEPSGPSLMDFDEALGDSDVELIMDEPDDAPELEVELPVTEAAEPASRPNVDALRVIGAQLQSAERERDELREKLERVENELEEAKQAVLRGAADLDNFRRRVRRDRDDDKKQAAASVVKDLLPVTDNFERARTQADEAVAQGEVPESFVDGIRMIENQLTEVLKRAGLEVVDHEGSFDPEIHEAMLSQPSSEVPDKSILQVFERGYRFNGKLLRPAKVLVASNPDQPAEPPPGEAAADTGADAVGGADQADV